MQYIILHVSKFLCPKTGHAVPMQPKDYFLHLISAAVYPVHLSSSMVDDQFHVFQISMAEQTFLPFLDCFEREGNKTYFIVQLYVGDFKAIKT